MQSKAFCPMMANRVLGHIEDIFRSLDILARLPEQVDPGAVLSLQELDTNYVLQHHRPPDAPVCGQYQSDGNPTIEVSARPQVGLPPFFCEATGYNFRVAVASTPSNLLMESTNRENCLVTGNHHVLKYIYINVQLLLSIYYHLLTAFFPLLSFPFDGETEQKHFYLSFPENKAHMHPYCVFGT